MTLMIKGRVSRRKQPKKPRSAPCNKSGVMAYLLGVITGSLFPLMVRTASRMSSAGPMFSGLANDSRAVQEERAKSGRMRSAFISLF